MIGFLRGRVVSRQPPRLLLDVNGVGYEIEAPMSTFYKLPMGEEAVTLHTHLAIREDAHVLYGFTTEDDKALFRELLKVSGVGGKMALAILSGMTADEFALTVQAADAATLTRLPGVGKKTAERLIVEMRDRLAKLPVGDGGARAVAAGGGADAPASQGADAISALVALGYRPADAARMVKSVEAGDMNTEEIIRAALQGAAS